MPRTLSIVLGTTALELTPDPTASNSTELIPKGEIVGVYPVKFNQKPATANISHNTVVGNFVLGETVTGGTSGATGKIFIFNGTGGLYLQQIVGTFVAGETLTGGTSGATSIVTKVSPQSYDGEWIYPYETMTIIEVLATGDRRFNIELQDVSNQATWNLGTLSALNAAIADINAWLP